MPKTAIYPGTFDPITFGHIDIIKKSLKIVDKLIVATTDSSDKEYFFSLEERLEILHNSLFKDLKLNKNKIKIVSFSSLTVNLCKKYKASIIVRGLRAVSDFEYEFQLAGMNKKLDKNVETIFLMSDIQNEIISSKFIKEIGKLRGSLKKFVTKSVMKAIKLKIEWKKSFFYFFFWFFHQMLIVRK